MDIGGLNASARSSASGARSLATSHHSDMVNLTERSGGSLGGVPASIVATLGIRGLCGFFLKSAHEDDKPSNISDYGNPTLAECRSIHYHAYEAYITVSMLLSLDRSIYGKLIEDLSNSYLVGTNHYPHTRAKMQDTIVCCRNRAARYGLCTPPGAVIFVQDNYNYSANGETHSHNGHREPQYLSKVKCFRWSGETMRRSEGEARHQAKL